MLKDNFGFEWTGIGSKRQWINEWMAGNFCGLMELAREGHERMICGWFGTKTEGEGELNESNKIYGIEWISRT